MIRPTSHPETGETRYQCAAEHAHASATEAALCDISLSHEVRSRLERLDALREENAALKQALREAYARIRSLEEGARRMLEEEA